MKSPINRTLSLLACVGLLLATVIGATNQERIRWSFNKPWFFNVGPEPEPKVEFGLRNDGVVVWREIKPAITNSPAEQVEPWGWITNSVFTNWTIYPTNIILNGNTNGPTPLDVR